MREVQIPPAAGKAWMTISSLLSKTSTTSPADEPGYGNLVQPRSGGSASRGSIYNYRMPVGCVFRGDAVLQRVA